MRNPYEAWKLYRANPCDLGCAKWLRPLGRAAKHLASGCQCCDGIRVILATLLGAMLPIELSISAVVLWYLASLYQELVEPTEEFDAPYNAYDENL